MTKIEKLIKKLRYEQNVTLQEIAKAMNIKKGTLEKQMRSSDMKVSKYRAYAELFTVALPERSYKWWELVGDDEIKESE